MPRKKAQIITQEVLDRLVGALQVGATYQIACSYAGISRKTLSRWKNRGQKAKKGPYREIWLHLQEAEAEGALFHLAQIKKAAMAGSLKASFWLLERRYPDSYGPNAAHWEANEDLLDEDEGADWGEDFSAYPEPPKDAETSRDTEE